jgi:hypothetical protein
MQYFFSHFILLVLKIEDYVNLQSLIVNPYFANSSFPFKS